MSQTQETIGRGEGFPTHLTKNPKKVTNTQCLASELKSREFWCVDCFSRVTRGLERSVEYGHKPDCEHSIRPFRGESA